MLHNKKLADKSLHNSFSELAQQLAGLGEQHDIYIRPFTDPSLPYFSALAQGHQQLIVENLQSYVTICSNTIIRGHSLRDSAQLLWTALKTLKLRPTSDLFQYITARDIIEVHNQNLVQIFRSFNFFEFCSYSMEELYCLPWPQLFRHNRPFEYELIGLAAEVFAGKHTKTFPINIEPHIIEEISSPKHNRLLMQINYGSPLYEEETNVVAATVVIEKGEPLSALDMQAHLGPHIIIPRA